VKIIKALIPLLLIGSLCFGQSSTSHFTKHLVKDLQEDYAKLRKHLETKNPVTYLYNSKKKITTYLDSLGQLINQPMTELDFYSLISPIASLISDGHNLIMPSKKIASFLEQHPHNLPLQIVVLDSELILLDHFSENQYLKPGCKIEAINGVTSSALLERLHLVLPKEGYQTQLATSYINKWFRFFYHVHFGLEEKYNITYTNLKGQTKETIIYGKTLDEITKKKEEKEPGTLEGKGIFVELIDDVSKIARLNIPTFWPVFLKEKYNQKKFRKEIDKCFDIIFQHNIRHLIIDIRDNEGGNPAYAVYVLKYLFGKPFTQAIEGRIVSHASKENLMNRTSKKWLPWYGVGTFKPKKKHYSGEIYVLTNGGTFSAAVQFASVLKKYNRAIFIGEETGGNPIIMTGNYIKEYRKLPNTKITHYSGNICTIYNDLELNNGRGIIPDYASEPTIDILLSKKDMSLETALSIINKRK